MHGEYRIDIVLCITFPIGNFFFRVIVIGIFSHETDSFVLFTFLVKDSTVRSRMIETNSVIHGKK